MFYTIYKITNTINGKFYIGQHKTIDLNDGYMGSGKRIKHAIKKYGIENFHKEILFLCDSDKQMNTIEKIIVVPDRETNYNLSFGGRTGGTDLMNSSPEIIARRDRPENKRKGAAAANKNGANLKGSQTHNEKLNDPEYKRNWSEKVELGKAKRVRYDCPHCDMNQLDPGNYARHLKAKHSQ